MALTNRTRQGVPKQQRPPEPPILKQVPIRRKIEISIAIIATSFGILWFGWMVISISRPGSPKPQTTPGKPIQRETDNFEANAKAGSTYGTAMGHMVGKLGQIYPTDAELETLAKTSAVDAGSTVNDFVFTGAFKRAFATGYREGRRSR